MYISLHTSEYDYPTATPYKEFPVNILLENIARLLNKHSDTDLTQLKNLELMLRHTNDHEQILINYIHKNGTQNPNNSMTNEIDINYGDYRFHLTYNETSFYHYAYWNDHGDYESRIVYHDHFYDEETTND